MWLCYKWKEAYDCPKICFNYVYNFKVIAYQILLHHCAQIISLNQMIWSSMLMTSKTNQLSWYKNSSTFLFISLFLSLNIEILVKFATTLKKVFRCKPLWKLKSYQALTFKFGRSSTLPKRKEGPHYEIMINFKKIAKQKVSL